MGGTDLDVPEADDACVLWHRRNLRLPDNRAVEVATESFGAVCPLFVFDPAFYGESGLACDARLRFLHECLADLEDAYADAGSELVLAHGNPLAVLDRFRDRGWTIVAARNATSRYGERRDDALGDDVRFVADDGLRHDQESREGWQDHAEAYFEADPCEPHTSGFGAHDVTGGTTVDAVEERYGVDPSKSSVPAGGREAALARLDRFVDVIHEYQRNISSPVGAKRYCSRLSAYFRFGALSLREAYRAVAEAPDCDGKDAFVSRLFWNRHYTQKLADWSGWTETAVNPVLEGLYPERDDDLIRAWKRGETGFPMVDASMRCLRETGWLNFRMRAMVASFFSLVLKQPWRVGADYMYYHLIDGDPAINYTQWQSQSGLKGVGAVRLYNPRKQVRDNDPDGEFVKRWCPELEPVPIKHLDRPERLPLHLQDEHGFTPGEDYPYPVVEYERERWAALDRLSELRDASEAAMQEPEVRRRASLSQRGRRSSGGDDDEAERAETQTGLDEFGG
jgi:deoxyribodipyrimidine photo-lyase